MFLGKVFERNLPGLFEEYTCLIPLRPVSPPRMHQMDFRARCRGDGGAWDEGHQDVSKGVRPIHGTIERIWPTPLEGQQSIRLEYSNATARSAMVGDLLWVPKDM